MFFVMAIAGMVCTALSVSGQTITDLKTGYWLGSTPAAQQKVKFLGVIAAAIAAGLTIVMLARAFQFGEAAPGDTRAVLAAPQASIMKALVEGFMSRQPVAYILFGAGAMIAADAWRCWACPALIFALGMYLPLELNTPALVGGFLAHFLDQALRARRRRRGRAHPRARRHHRLGPDGRRRAGRRLRRRAAPVPGYAEDWIKTPFYDIDPRLPAGLGGPVRRHSACTSGRLPMEGAPSGRSTAGARRGRSGRHARRRGLARSQRRSSSSALRARPDSGASRNLVWAKRASRIGEREHSRSQAGANPLTVARLHPRVLRDGRVVRLQEPRREPRLEGSTRARRASQAAGNVATRGEIGSR